MYFAVFSRSTVRIGIHFITTLAALAHIYSVCAFRVFRGKSFLSCPLRPSAQFPHPQRCRAGHRRRHGKEIDDRDQH